MAILLVAALLLQAAPTSAPPDDVVVIGERMRRLKVSIRTDRKTKTQRCVVKRASGDPVLDARLCEATLACAAHLTSVPEMKACLTPTMEAYVAERRERHRQQVLSTTPGDR
jgi:hypothetical protein